MTKRLRFYTTNNAYITFSGKDKGSLERRKLADFVVIARDYLNCPVDDIKSVRVEQTWLGGQVVNQRM